MKVVAGYIIGAILLLAFTFAVMWGVRLFSNATTPLVLHQPKPGITCASMVTADGVALSCWKESRQ